MKRVFLYIGICVLLLCSSGCDLASNHIKFHTGSESAVRFETIFCALDDLLAVHGLDGSFDIQKEDGCWDGALKTENGYTLRVRLFKSDAEDESAKEWFACMLGAPGNEELSQIVFVPPEKVLTCYGALVEYLNPVFAKETIVQTVTELYTKQEGKTSTHRSDYDMDEAKDAEEPLYEFGETKELDHFWTYCDIEVEVDLLKNEYFWNAWCTSDLNWEG